MPKSTRTKTKNPSTSSTHFPSKPYMRGIANTPATASALPPAVAWSTADDELLLRSKSSGKKWVEISPLFEGKTSNACRKRHARLVTHTQVEWDEFKERDLAVEFVNAKVNFFKTIAGNMKLEWRQVEKKCLELGFKSLLEKGKRFPTIQNSPQDQTLAESACSSTKSVSSEDSDSDITLKGDDLEMHDKGHVGSSEEDRSNDKIVTEVFEESSGVDVDSD